MSTPRSPSRVATIPGADGKGVKNLILLGLPGGESDEIFSKSQFMEAPLRFIFHEAGEPIKFVYFINSGLASFLSVMTDGKSIEVGLAGREGFVGLPLVVGLSSSPTQVIMQVKGSAYRISVKGCRTSNARIPCSHARDAPR